MDADIDWTATSAVDVVLFATAMAVLAVVLWLSYRTMEHPRLPVLRATGKPPRVMWTGVVRYLISTPLVVGFWMLVLLTLLASAARDRSGVQIVIAASAVIGGARLLAHLKPDIAHELAKSVPITILSFIIIGGGLTGIESFLSAFDQLPFDLVDSYWIGLIAWDVFLTAGWFLAVRIAWHREQRRIEQGRPPANRIVRAAQRLRRIGYTAPAD